MAIRFNATDANYLNVTTGLPTETAFTVCFWLKVTTATSYRVPWTYNGSTGRGWYCGSDGLTWHFFDGGGDTTLFTAAAGEWRFFAYRCNGSTRDTYHSPANGGTLTKTSVNSSTTLGGTSIRLGRGMNSNESIDGCVDSYRVWDAVLTDDEIHQEQWGLKPQRWGNLHTWLDLQHATNAGVDYSGSGHTYTVNGTLTTEAGGPVGWGDEPLTTILVSAAGSSAMAGTSDGVATTSGTMTGGAGVMAGGSTAGATTAGAMTGHGVMTGTAAGAASTSGGMAGAGALAGSAAGASTTAGVMGGGAGAMAGTTAGAAAASGTMAGAGVMAGAATGGSGASGAMFGAGSMAGGSAGTSTASLVTGSGMSGSSAGSSSTSGTMTGTGAMAGSAAGAAATAGAMTGHGALAGSSVGVAATSGAMTGSGVMSGSASGTSTATLASEQQGAALAGSSTGTSITTGTMLGAGVMSGASAGASTATLGPAIGVGLVKQIRGVKVDASTPPGTIQRLTRDQHNVEWPRSDTGYLEIAISRQSWARVNLTGGEVTMALKKRTSQDLLWEKTAALTSPTTGVARFSIAQDDVDALDENQRYVYDVHFTDTSAVRWQVVPLSLFTVLPTVVQEDET